MRIVSWTLAVAILASGAAASLKAGYPEPHAHLVRNSDAHGIYRARVYTGAYYRWPYDYRTRFDLPWYAGPSRAHWPIPAPAPSFCEPGPTIINTPFR